MHSGGNTAIADQLVMEKSQLGNHVRMAGQSPSNANMASKRLEDMSSAILKKMNAQMQQLSLVKPDFGISYADLDAQKARENAPLTMIASKNMKLKKNIERDTMIGRHNADLSEVQRSLIYD